MARFLNCKQCGQVYNVSAKMQYHEDNYTCPRCAARLIRTVKSTQPTANRIECMTKITKVIIA